jgi:hypothetical protein
VAEPIDRLVELADSIGIDRQSVLDALYVLRMPRSLSGLVPAIESFEELRVQYPELGQCDTIEGYQQRLQVLGRLAELASNDQVFSGHKLKRNVERQLEPYCGDSGIVDALLTRQRSDGLEVGEQFRALVAWFVWQGIRFNRSTLSDAHYAEYLRDPGGLSLQKISRGASIYNAWLQLRRMGRLEYEQRLGKVVRLLIPFDAVRTKRQALLIRFANVTADHLRNRVIDLARRR